MSVRRRASRTSSGTTKTGHGQFDPEGSATLVDPPTPLVDVTRATLPGEVVMGGDRDLLVQLDCDDANFPRVVPKQAVASAAAGKRQAKVLQLEFEQ